MKMKRILSMVLALTATTACVGTLSACKTANPEVKIVLSFQTEEYELNYKLYRKIAPATVEHFLTLAENGYYDGLCVHDYADSRMYTGGYSFDAQATDNGGLVYKKYYDIVKTYNLPTTVYTDSTKRTPTYTLYGEFGANKFTVENGDKKEEYGSLTMFYTDKTAGEVDVYLDHEEAGSSINRDYKYNSATSLFFISLSTSEMDNNDYCTFATLNGEKSVKELEELHAAINEYVQGNDDSKTSVSVRVDEDDTFDEVKVKGKYVSYDVLSSPVVIKKVSVKKY